MSKTERELHQKQGICDIVRGMNTGLILLAWGAMIVAVVAVLLKTGILTVKIERRDENEDKIEEEVKTDQEDD